MPVRFDKEKGKWCWGSRCVYDTKADAEKAGKAIEVQTHNLFQSIPITCNFIGITRNDRMEGKEYLVAPMIMLVEGVHAGSNGPLYYPAEELGKTPAVWNYKPVVVYHPQRNGEGCSACDPDIITNRKVGLIMNAVFSEGKLKAEAWLDIERAKVVDNRILDAIEKKEVMELSTGVFTDNEATEGKWNGESYSYIARNYRPDHLALLPDMKGACSIQDGAGFLRLNVEKNPLLDEKEKYYIEDNAVSLLPYFFGFVKNSISFDEIRNKLQTKLREKVETGWITETFDSWFVYEKDGKLYKQSYVNDKNGLRFEGLPIEAVRKIQYVDMNGKIILNNRKDLIMEKEKLVKTIIESNSNGFGEADKEELMAMNEGTLKKLMPTDNETAEEKKKRLEEEAAKALADEKKKKTENAETSIKVDNGEEQTAEEYITKAPPAIQSILRNAQKIYDEQKGKLVTFITANKSNTFMKEQLDKMDMSMLQSLAKLAVTPETALPRMNFSGQADVIDITTNDVKPNDLDLPVINFDKA